MSELSLASGSDHFNIYPSAVHSDSLFTHQQKRSVEALKERYYSVCNRLSRARDPSIEESQLIAYDAPHECRRKLQLEKLLNR